MISVSVKTGHLNGKKLFISINSLFEQFNDELLISHSSFFRFLFSPPTPEVTNENIEFSKISLDAVADYCISEGKFISFNNSSYSENGTEKHQALVVKFSRELVHYDVLNFIQNIIFELRCEHDFPRLRPLHAGFYSGKKFFGESDSTGLDSDGFINKL